MTSVGVPWAMTWPPCVSGSRPHIQQMVRCHHGFCIRARPPPLCCPGRAGAAGSGASADIPLMKTDRRFRRECRGRRTRPEPICVASLMRWPSPPDKVAAARSNVRIIQTDIDEKPSRSRISFKMRWAITNSRSVNFNEPKKSAAARTERCVTSAIDCLATLTDKLSGRSLAPLQDLAGFQQGEVFFIRTVGESWHSRCRRRQGRLRAGC